MATTAKAAGTTYAASYRSSGIDGIGINEQGASKILDAIEQYKKTIQQKINNLGVTQSVVKNGIQGTGSQKDLQNMIEQIKQKQTSYLNYLDQYIKLLTDIKATYKKNDSSNQVFTDASKNLK